MAGTPVSAQRPNPNSIVQQGGQRNLASQAFGPVKKPMVEIVTLTQEEKKRACDIFITGRDPVTNEKVSQEYRDRIGLMLNVITDALASQLVLAEGINR